MESNAITDRRPVPMKESSPHPVLDRSAKLREAATAMGWSCLDDAWAGWHTPHRFVCDRGHAVPALPSAVLRQIATCGHCRHGVQLARLQVAAARDGVICQATAWRGTQARYPFRCPCGHEWTQAPRHGLKGTGQLRCPLCANAVANARRRLADGLARLKQAAKDEGGVCLSDSYEGRSCRYRFRCERGHEWETVGGEVLRGAWCRVCATEEKRAMYRLVDGLERLKAAAAKKGGTCESGTYLGRASRYLFNCGQGHTWQTVGSSVLNGSWCPTCSQQSKRLGLDAARETARTRGGQCLSDHYVNSRTKMAWVCHQGHTWQAVFSSVRRGSWCPACANIARINNRKSKAGMRYSASDRHGT